jgi:hypothetical protein
VRHNRDEFADPGRTAAAEHAAKCVMDVAAGGFDGARRQIGVARAADVLGESPGRIIGHHLHSMMAVAMIAASRAAASVGAPR